MRSILPSMPSIKDIFKKQFYVAIVLSLILGTPLSSMAYVASTSSTAPITIDTQATTLTSGDQDYSFTIPADTDATTCQGVDCVAPDPYSIAANLDTILGGFGGPISFDVKYDADLSWIANLGYTRMFSNQFGMSAKLAGGENELRGNITGGVAFTPNQEFKITYEYLYQNAPFTFESGEVHEWIGQNAVGGAYQYILPHSFLRAIELSGNWAEANNKDLDTKVVYQNNTPFADLERVAGGEEGTGLASLKFLPFSRTLLTVGGGYSQVNYDTVYDDSNDSRSTVAYNADLSVLATCITKLSTDVNNTASSREADVKVNQLIPDWDTELAVWGQYSHGYGAQPDSKSVMFGFSYPAPKAYAFEGLDQLTNLYNWVDEPVVYYQRVLAIADEALQKYTLDSKGLSSQTIGIGDFIHPVSTNSAFSFDSSIYDQVTYSLYTTKAGSSKDFTGALNLRIQKINNFTAQVSTGSGGTPAGTQGKYLVTITAYGQKKGLKQPIVSSSSFKLIVSSSVVWQKNNLPPGTLGKPYPCVNLTAGKYAITPGFPNDNIIYSLQSSQPWLQVSTKCLNPSDDSGKVSSGVNYYLVAGGANQNIPVPIGADPAVVLRATSQVNGSQANRTFDLTFNSIAPVWQGSPNLGTVSMTVLGQPLPVGNPIPLDQYIAPGTGIGLSITIDPDESHGTNFVPANWGIQHSGNHFYLKRMNNSQDVTGPTIVSVIATNTTSTTSVSNPVQLTLSPTDVVEKNEK